MSTGKHYNNRIIIKCLTALHTHIHTLHGILTDGNFPLWHSAGCQCGFLTFPARSEPAEPGTHVPLRGLQSFLPLLQAHSGCEVTVRGNGSEGDMGQGLPLLSRYMDPDIIHKKWHSKNGNPFFKTLPSSEVSIKPAGPNWKREVYLFSDVKEKFCIIMHWFCFIFKGLRSHLFIDLLYLKGTMYSSEHKWYHMMHHTRL